jgi:hypothetical protein
MQGWPPECGLVACTALPSLPPSSEIDPGCMLRSVVGALAANMMLVRCNSDVPISLACSKWIGNSPDHGIIGTTSLGDLEGLRLGRQWV